MRVGKRAANRQGKKRGKKRGKKNTPRASNVSVPQSTKRYGLIVLCYAAELLVSGTKERKLKKATRRDDTCSKPDHEARTRSGLESAYIFVGVITMV